MFFSRPELQILTPNPWLLPFENFLWDALSSEQKPSVKKKRRSGRSETGQPALILKFTSRVGKILTGSISQACFVKEKW